MSIEWRERHGLPEGFLSVEARQLDALLGGPTLIHLPGERSPPLFVSILLHGNEVTGLAAVQSLLHRYRNRELPRALSIFVANTAAAAQGLRQLPEQPDWNRVWPMAPPEASAVDAPEAELAARVWERVAELRPFAVVDVHNNNGRNPHYACINRLAPAFLQLARRFTRRVLYFTVPPGTLTQSFAGLTPAVTIECGPVGEPSGAAHAADFVDGLLALSAIPETAPAPGEVALYRSAARITVAPGVSVGVGDTTNARLRLPRGLEALNWREQSPGTLLATVSEDVEDPVLMLDDAADRDWLRRTGERIELARSGTLAMLTLNTDIVVQDCFGYLLEHLQH